MATDEELASLGWDGTGDDADQLASALTLTGNLARPVRRGWRAQRPTAGLRRAGCGHGSLNPPGHLSHQALRCHSHRSRSNEARMAASLGAALEEVERGYASRLEDDEDELRSLE